MNNSPDILTMLHSFSTKSTEETIDFLVRELAPASILNLSTLSLPVNASDRIESKNRYELAIVPSCDDGDELFSIVERLVSASDYILCLDIYKYDSGMLSLSYIMKHYQTSLEYGCAFPCLDACHLIIKPLPQALTTGRDSRPRRFSDPQSMLILSDLRPDCSVLSISSGNGEFAHFIHTHCHCKVTGVDYSRDAVRASNELYGSGSNDSAGLHYEDILTFSPETPFDRVMAVNVIEYIDQSQLEILLAKVADELLSQDGVFVIQTPNRLNAAVDYVQKRQKALESGLYLPKTPYGSHDISTLTKDKLECELKRFFPFVEVWLDELGEEYPLIEIQGRTINAMASHSPISQADLADRQTQQQIAVDSPLDITLHAPESFELKSREQTPLPVKVVNRSHYTLRSFKPYPVRISYHVRDELGNDVHYDGKRGTFDLPLFPGEESEVALNVYTELEPGNYIAEITLVQEDVMWWDDFIDTAKVSLTVR